MRQLLILASLLFISTAVADDKLDTKELDKSSTNMSTTTTATDYNSSRSNNINAAVPADGTDGDKNENDEQSATRAQDYNSSRSNTTSAIEVDKGEDACDEDEKDCPADDKAVEYQDGDDYTLRKRPGR